MCIWLTELSVVDWGVLDIKDELVVADETAGVGVIPSMHGKIIDKRKFVVYRLLYQFLYSELRCSIFYHTWLDIYNETLLLFQASELQPSSVSLVIAAKRSGICMDGLIDSYSTLKT